MLALLTEKYLVDIGFQNLRLVIMQFQQYGMMNVPEENLENYANEMLKNEDERRKSVERILEKKVMDHIRTNVKLDNKQITTEKFNKLFENN